jgi:hypothetical protein
MVWIRKVGMILLTTFEKLLGEDVVTISTRPVASSIPVML